MNFNSALFRFHSFFSSHFRCFSSVFHSTEIHGQRFTHYRNKIRQRNYFVMGEHLFSFIYSSSYFFSSSTPSLFFTSSLPLFLLFIPFRGNFSEIKWLISAIDFILWKEITYQNNYIFLFRSVMIIPFYFLPKANSSR